MPENIISDEEIAMMGSALDEGWETPFGGDV